LGAPLTPDRQARVRDLLDLEKLKYNQLADEKRIAFEEKRRLLALRPMQPAGILQSIVKEWRNYLNELANGRIDIRRELALTEPTLASDDQLEKLMIEIERIVPSQNQRHEMLRHFAGGQQVPPGVLQAIAERWQREDSSIISSARNRIGQLKIEVRQGLHRLAPHQMKVEINNSTVHQLNLGTILGDMNNSVTTLAQGGHGDVAAALKEFTERVASSDDSALSKRDVVENLAFISQQAALPAGERRQGLLKAALSHVQTAVQVVGTLSQAWATFGPIIEGFFKN
jgi:hypothetical protein